MPVAATTTPFAVTDDVVLDSDPVVARVRSFALDTLLPTALGHDRSGVPESHITGLRALGALNHSAPVAYGGLAIDPALDRRIHEWIAYADLNTWLIWAQHATSLPRILALTAERGPGPLATRALRGDVLLGAGLSDVRGYPDRFIAATRVDGGWRFDGTISWVSGWGLNHVLHVAGVEQRSGTVVIGLLPVDERTVAADLDLQAVRGSRTLRVDLAGAVVTDADVLTTLPWEEWTRSDQANSGDAHAGVFGLAFRALDELATATDPDARAVAQAWLPRLARLRDRAYDETDRTRASGVVGHLADERAATKQEAIDALGVLTQALLVARAGRGLTGDDTAQLHARAALFLRVQSQTRRARARNLQHLAIPVR